MLVLSDFDHLRSDKRIRFKEEIVDGVSLTVICYMIATNDLWDLPLAKECRGITFNTKTGDLVSRPFAKFFNVGENEENQLHNLLELAGRHEVYEKRDGSMITPALINGRIYLKTKKSFYSEVAQEAQRLFDAGEWDEHLLRGLMTNWIHMGYTPIYEFTSPQNRIVIDYGEKPELDLICLRNNETGEINYSSTHLKSFGYDLLSAHKKCVDEDLDGEEGFVIKIGQHLCKIKGEWYNRNHPIRTYIRERDLFDMIMDETIDDLKAQVSEAGLSLGPIEEIERLVDNEIKYSEIGIQKIMDNIESKKIELRDVMKYLSEHEWDNYSSCIFKRLRGHDDTESFRKLIISEMRDNMSLRTIYSNFQKGNEDEAA